MAEAFYSGAFESTAFEVGSALAVVAAQTISVPSQTATAEAPVGATVGHTVPAPTNAATVTSSIAVDTTIGIAAPAQTVVATVGVSAAASQSIDVPSATNDIDDAISVRVGGAAFDRWSFESTAFETGTAGGFIEVPAQTATIGATSGFTHGVEIAVPAQSASATIIVAGESDQNIAAPSQTATVFSSDAYASSVSIAVPDQAAEASVHVGATAAGTVSLTQSTDTDAVASFTASNVIQLPTQNAFLFTGHKPDFVARRSRFPLMRARATGASFKAMRPAALNIARRAA